MNKVKALPVKNNAIGFLKEIVEANEIKNVIIVAQFKDGSFDAGWNHGISDGEITYGAAVLDVEIKKMLF